MTKYDGKDMAFKFGSFTVPAGYLTGVDWPDTRDELDVTGATQDDKEFLPSERSSTISVSGWDDVANTIRSALLTSAAQATAEFWPQGATSGKPLKSAAAFITASQFPEIHNQGAPFTVTFRVTLAVTNTTVSP